MATPILPNAQKIQKTVVKLKEVCQQFDILNFTLDELIAKIDAEIPIVRTILRTS
jgi:hypothetical protein